MLIASLVIDLPLRVRLSNSLPLASSSWLQTPRKFSPLRISPLSLVLVLLLLLVPLPQIPIPPMPFSSGVTAAIFHTSFNALAFKVAAPRRAAYEGTYTSHANIRRQKITLINRQDYYYLSLPMPTQDTFYPYGTERLINNETIL